MYTLKPIEQKYNAEVEHVIRTCLMEMGHTHEGCAWTDPFLGRFSEVYAPDNAAYWVAVDDDDHVVGGAGIGPWPARADVCELQKMYILPAARHKGLSKQLMETALAFARERYDYCYLETFANMEAAMKLYESFGFEYLDGPITETEHFTCDKWMLKDLRK